MPDRIRSDVTAGSSESARALGGMGATPRRGSRSSLRRDRPRAASCVDGSAFASQPVLDDGLQDVMLPAAAPAGAPAAAPAGGAPSVPPSPPTEQPPVDPPLRASDAAAQLVNGNAAPWKAMSTIAPNAGRTAQMMEKQQLALQQELEQARKSIVASRYGQIENRGPRDSIKVQQRSAHSTYSYLMRQRKAHEASLRRQQTFERNYVTR